MFTIKREERTNLTPKVWYIYEEDTKLAITSGYFAEKFMDIVEALSYSNPWDKSDNDLWRCIHCGGLYNWNSKSFQVGHRSDCIWLAVQDNEQVENEDQ